MQEVYSMNMKISINSKVFFKVLSDMKNIEHKSIDTQWFVEGGIMGGIWVELHEVPP